MKRKTLVLVAGGVLLLCGLAVLAVLLHPRTVDVPYAFPVQPGTEEWEALDGHSAMVEACQIPEDILARMSTGALAQTVLDYPLLIDMTAYSTPEQGVNAVRRQFNGLDELLGRPDGFEALAEAAEQAEGEAEFSHICVDTISVALGHSEIDDPAREAKLLEDYAQQLAAVQVTTGQVRRVDAVTLRQLKYAAAGGLYDDDYGLSGLMDELSLIFAEQEVAGRYADRAVEPVNVSAVCLHSYGPLKGQSGERMPVAMSRNDPVEFEIKLEDSVHGVKLDEGGVYRASMGLEGPEHGEQLHDGHGVTHTFACGVLFGAVVEVSWDLADKTTGAVKSSHHAVLVPEKTALLQTYAARGLVDAGGHIYVDSGAPDCMDTGYWYFMKRFKDDIKEKPIRFLTGDAKALCPGCGR